MFNKNYLPESFDHDRALAIAFEALKELVGIGEVARDYVAAEKEVVGFQLPSDTLVITKSWL